MNKIIKIIMFMFVALMSVSIVSAETIFYNQSTDYISKVTNGQVKINTINSGWDIINSTDFQTNAGSTNFDRGAFITLDSDIKSSNFINISFENWNSHDRRSQTILVTNSSLGSNDGYSLWLNTQSTDSIILYRYDNGAITNLGSVNVGVFGNDYKSVNWLVNGSDHKIYFQGVNVLNVTDSSYNSFKFVDVRTQAYQTGEQRVRDLVIIEGLISSPTPIITINNPTNGSYYNSNQILNVTTSINTNLSFSLNGASNQTLGTNINSSSNTTLSLVEGLNNLTVYSNYSGEITSESISFTLDTTLPTISDNLLTEYNAYTFNPNSSCSDTNLDTCILYINNQTISLPDSSITMTVNGNLTYNITAVDLAGNVAYATGVILINPYVTIQFQEPDTDPITNYSLDGTFYTDTAQLKLYDLTSTVPANVTLLFEKLGYESTNITISLNSTSNINDTYNISLAKIIVNVYDRETLALINQTVTLTLVSEVGKNATTTTGQYNFTGVDLTNATYHVIAESSNYSTEVVYFDFTNQDQVNVNIYMLSTNSADAGSITIITKDTFGQFIQGSICEAREWVPSESSYVQRAESITNANGEALLNIEIGTKEYIFYCSISVGSTTYTAESPAEIVFADLDTRTLILTTGTTQTIEALSGFTYTLTESVASNISNISISYADTGNQVTQVCITFYDDSGYDRTQVAKTCSTASSGNIYESFEINNTFDLIAIVTAQVNNALTINLATYIYQDINNIENYLNDYGLDIFVPTMLLLLALGLGVFIQNIYIGVSLVIVSQWLAFAIVPTTISGTIATSITIIAILILYGGFKSK